MRRRVIVFLFLSLIINVLSAKNNGTQGIPAEKPTLVVGIFVEQMRFDYLNKYWGKFEKNGFKKMANEGTFCRNAQINFMFTPGAASCASAVTGTYPSYHGIISTNWYNNLKNVVIHCTYDENATTIGGSYEAGKHSPHNLLSTSFADELKIAHNGKSKVYGIGLDPETAILSTGHTADGVFWLDSKKGGWVTSSFYADSLSPWINDFNAKGFSDSYLDRLWEPLYPIEQYTESLPDQNDYEVGFDGQVVFPYDLSKLKRKEKNKVQYNILKATPFGNTFTKDFATSLIVNEGLGKDDDTDYLSVVFSSTEYIGKAFGPTSAEMEDAFLRLDKELAHFLEFLEAQVGKEKVLVYLVSTSGVAHIPSYLNTFNIPSGYFNSASALALLQSYLNVTFGEGDWVKYYHAQQVFLNRQLIEDSDLSLGEFQSKVAQFLLNFEGVSNTITGHTLTNTSFTTGWQEKTQHSYNQKHSGDVILLLKPGWVEKGTDATGHGSTYNYDNHVPVMFYGWKTKRQKITRRIEIIDIAPTLCSLLNISFPGAAVGEPIFEMVD